MNTEELEAFCKKWLDAWTGNDPAGLIEYYAEDAFYADPVVRKGLRGHAEMLPYLTRLLAANPDWRGEIVEAIPTAKGCALRWHATIPVGETVVEEDGADIVEIEGGKITRNEVFFDRTALLDAMS